MLRKNQGIVEYAIQAIFNIGVCMVCEVLITAEVLRASFQDSFIVVSAWGTYISSYMRQLFTSWDDGFQPVTLRCIALDHNHNNTETFVAPWA